MKKRFSLCLLLVTLLVAAFPAQAVEKPNSKTVITAEPYLPDIKIEVVVPASGNVYINPNRLPVKVGANIENKQVVSDSFCIENLSDVPLKVSVEVTGKIKSGSDMGLTTSSTANLTTKSKKAFMYLEILSASDPSTVEWSNAFNAKKHVVVREATTAKKDIVIVGANEQEKRFGVFRLAGDCIQNPREEWTAKDGVEVEVAFTFSPLPVGTTIP